MKKFFYITIILVLIAGFCVVSCPDEDDHCKAIAKALGGDANRLQIIYIDNKITVDNHFLFSKGKITDDTNTTVSLGILNHVFVKDWRYLYHHFSS